MSHDDSVKVDGFPLTRPWPEADAASLPSFKPLPQHRRANSGQARRPIPRPPERPHSENITLPPLDLGPFRAPEPVLPPRASRRYWRRFRGVAMLLVGGIAAALVYPVLESDHPPMTEVKYYTVLPRAVPAAPPPELLYVDKWRIVAIDPFRLAEAAKTEQPETVEPVKAETKAVALFAPALPIAPPPEIIMIERGDTKQPERKRPVAEKRPPPSSGLKASVSAGPKKPENTGDVLEQIDRWFAGANKR